MSALREIDLHIELAARYDTLELFELLQHDIC